MSKTISIIFLFCFLMTACFSPPSSKKNFVVAMDRYPAQLDPRFATGAYAAKISGLIFNGLFRYDQNLSLVPDLASGFEFLSETKLRILLRQDVFFHDGQPLRSFDVIATYKSVLDPAVASPFYRDFKKIKSMKALDDFTFEIELESAFSPFMSSLTLGILPRSEAQKKQAKWIGTGPFRYLQSQEGQWIDLVKNEQYFGEKSALNKVRFRSIKDANTRVMELLKGNIHLVQNNLHYTLVKHLREKKQFTILRAPGIIYHYLGLNLKDPILKKLKVRQAIAHLIDRDQLIRFYQKSFARKSHSLLAPEHWAFTGDLPAYDYDLDKAKQLLDEAGLPDPDGDGPKTRFTLHWIAPNKPEDLDKIMSLAHFFKKAGIGVKIRSTDFSVFKRDVDRGNFQIYSLNWVGVREPDLYYYLFNSAMIPPAGANRGNFIHTEMDLLTRLARMENETAKRKEYYVAVQKILHQQLPYISLWYEDNVALLHQDYEGYQLTPQADFNGLVQVRKK